MTKVNVFSPLAKLQETDGSLKAPKQQVRSTVLRASPKGRRKREQMGDEKRHGGF
ncbi:MAG TPA: hypothetical protein VE944_24195 [Nostoc sp.]|uniref:hypothetical protein n=1 Tax=Nostoc sp. TaxID=1180 RepID=UPI002D31011F|nr:hypothetical protein [Nostoc sp.]HYX17397.1 hypothetical protein [Nostoc sp.]